MAVKKVCLCFLAVSLAVCSYSALAAQKAQKRSVDGLIYDLKHPEAERRKEAAFALGKNKVQDAVPALIQMTEDEQDLVRLEAVRALVRINDSSALDAYARLTHDRRKEIQEKAIEGIVNVYVVEASGFVSGVKRFVNLLNPLTDGYNALMVEPYLQVSQVAIDGLGDLLDSPETGIRKDAAIALGILRAGSALPLIQSSLSQETNSGVIVELIRSIYKIGDPSAGQSVIPLMRDPDKKVHDEAIFTLGRLRVVEAVPHLKEIFESGMEERKKFLGVIPVSGSDDLQKNIMEALAYIGDSSCQQLFMNALQDERDFYRGLGAEGLGRAGDQSLATEVARKYLAEESSNVKLAMSYALYRLGRDEHLVELVDNLGKDQSYHYLLEMNSQEIEKLYPYLHKTGPSIQMRLISVMGLRAPASALPIIQEMMQSEDPEIASAANLAFRRIQGRDAGFGGP